MKEFYDEVEKNNCSKITLYFSEKLETYKVINDTCLPTIADLTGINYCTLRLIHNRSTERPQVQTAIKLFNFFRTEPEVKLGFIREFYPETAELIDDAIKSNPPESEMDSPDMSYVSSDIKRYKIYSIIQNSEGISRDHILEKYGHEYLKEVETMLIRDVLVSDDSGMITAKKIHTYDIDKKIQKQKIRSQIELADSEHDSTSICTATANVNPENFEKIQYKIRHAVMSIINSFKDDSVKGDIPIFVGTICGSFDKSTLGK